MYPHYQADLVQINAPDYDPDIDDDNQHQPHNNRVRVSIQGILTSPTESSVEEDESDTAPAITRNTESTQDTNWPDAVPVQILGMS